MSCLSKSSAGITSPHWDRQLAELDERIANLIQQIGREEKADHEARALAFFQQTLRLHDLRTQVLDIVVSGSLETQEPTGETLPLPLPRVYTASKLFLDECLSYLTQGRAEWMRAVTGIRLGNYYTLERMIHLDLETQSAARATADMDSVFRALLSLADSGHALHAVFHSHRSRGMPGPSSIDKALQQRLDRGGYPAIQAIFSEDGFVRFFGGQEPFEVKVYGTGVEKVNERVYRLADKD